VALCAAWLIAAVHSRRDTLLAMALRSQVLVGLGWLSYSLYLWHYPILSALAGRGVVPANDVPLIGLPLSLAAAIFSYAVIERPFLRFKSQLTQPLGRAKLLAS
jgi:peptidoglycan/LPS O-acetylase OafA/YrhL